VSAPAARMERAERMAAARAECSVDGCDRPTLARGLCNKHYQRWRSNGDPLVSRVPRDETPTERFWLYVDKDGPGGCWLWTKALNIHGYGKFSLAGRSVPAHRCAYALFVGPVPEGLDIDHTCHNIDADCAGGRTCLHRRCVNPAHLEPVTPRENVLRGRTFVADNVAKTHCPKGHPYDEANTRRYKGGRVCRACDRARLADRRRRTEA
jgi:hypothetical protein